MGINYSVPSVSLVKDVEARCRERADAYPIVQICSRLLDAQMVERLIPQRLKSKVFHGSTCNLDPEERKQVEHALSLQHAEVRSGLLNVRKLDQLVQHYMLQSLAFPGEPSHFEACRAVLKRLFYLWTTEYHVSSFNSVEDMIVTKIDKPIDEGIHSLIKNLTKEIDDVAEKSRMHLSDLKSTALPAPERLMKAFFVVAQCAMLSSDHRSTAWLQLVSGCSYLLYCACQFIDEALSKYQDEILFHSSSREIEHLEGVFIQSLHQSFLCSLLPLVFTMTSLMEHHTELCIQLLPYTQRFTRRLCRLINAVPRLSEELTGYEEGVMDQIRASLEESSFSGSTDDSIWFIAPRDKLVLLLRMSSSSLGYMLSGASRGKARSDEEEFSRPWLLSGLFSGGVSVEAPTHGQPIRKAWTDTGSTVTDFVFALSSYDILQSFYRFEDESNENGEEREDVEMKMGETKDEDTDPLSDFIGSMFFYSEEGFQPTEQGLKLRAWLSSHYKMNPVTRKKYGHDRYQTAEVLMLAACIYHAGEDEGRPLWHTVKKTLQQMGNDYSQHEPTPSLKSIWETVFGFRQWLMDMHSAYREAGGQIDELEQGGEDMDEEPVIEVDEDAKEEEMDHTAEEEHARRHSRAMSDSSNRSSSHAPGLLSDRIRRINPVDHPTSFDSFYVKLLRRLAFLCGNKTTCTDWLHEMGTGHAELDQCQVRLKPAMKTPSVVDLKSISRHARSLHTLRPHPFRALHPREWMYERIATAVASSSQGLYGEDSVYSPVQRRCKAIEIYSKEGWAFPVEVAAPTLFAQDTRAQQRTVAMRCMERICAEKLPSVALRDVLLPFRSSLRGMTEHEEVSHLLPLVKIIGQTEHCVAHLLDRRMAISQPSGPSTPSHSFGRKGDHETGSQSSDHDFDPIRLRQQIEDSFEDDEGNDADETPGEESEESNASVELQLPSKVSRLVAMEHHAFSELDCCAEPLKMELRSYVDGLYKELKEMFMSYHDSSKKGRLLSLQPVVQLFTLDWRVVQTGDGDVVDSSCDNLRIMLQCCFETWLKSCCTTITNTQGPALTWRPVPENHIWLCLSRGMVSREQTLAYIWSGIKERGAKVPSILNSSLQKALMRRSSDDAETNDFCLSLKSSSEIAYLGSHIEPESLLLCYLHVISQEGILSRAEAEKMFKASCSELSQMQNTDRSIVSIPSVAFLQRNSKSTSRGMGTNFISVDYTEINASAQVIKQCSGAFDTDDMSLFSKQLFGLYGLLSIHHLGECFAQRKVCSFINRPLHVVLAAALRAHGDRLRSMSEKNTPHGEWSRLCFLAASKEENSLVERLVASGLVSSLEDAQHVASLTSSTDGVVLTRLSGKMLYFMRSLLDQPERYTTKRDYPALEPIWSSEGLATLFALLVYGGLAQQRAVLPVLHLVLPAITPFRAGSALQSTTDDEQGSSVKLWLQNSSTSDSRAMKASEAVPLLLLSLMGRKRCFFPMDADESSLAPNLQEGGFGFGHELSSVCSLVVGVLRTLLRLRSVYVTVQFSNNNLSVAGCQARVSSWGRNIMNVLRRLLESGKKHLSDRVEASEQTSSALGSAASALWAVGGLPELLRSGSRVVQRHDTQTVPVSPESPAESGEDEMVDESNPSTRLNETPDTSAKVENEEEEDVGVVVMYERGSSLALVALPCGDISATSAEEGSGYLSCGSKNFSTSLTKGSTASQYARLKQGNIGLSDLFMSPANCGKVDPSFKVSLPSFHNEELNLACEKAVKSIVDRVVTMDGMESAVVETSVLLNHQPSLDSWELVWQPLNQLRALDEVPLIDYSLNLKAASMNVDNPVPDVCIGEGFLELLSDFAAIDLPQTALHAILQHQYHTRTRHFPPLREIYSEHTLYALTWVWKMKAMATSAIASIFRQQSHHVETAIFQKMLPTLMETALRPLPLPSRGPGFLDASNLAHIVHVTWERALESHLSRESVDVWGLSKTIRSSGLSTKDLDCSDVPESLSINVGGTRSLANALFLHRDYLTEGLDALPVYNVKDADIPEGDTDALIPDAGNTEPGTSMKPSELEQGDSSACEPDDSFNESMSAPPPGVDIDTWNSAYDIIEVSAGRSIEDCYIALKKNNYNKDEAALWLLSHPPSHHSVAAERERLRLVQESNSKSTSTTSNRKKVNASAVVEGVHMNEPLISQNGLVASDSSMAPSRGKHTVARQPAERPVATGQSIVESIPGLLVASDAPLVCMSEAILLPVSRPQKLRPGTLVAIMASPVIAATDNEFQTRLRRGRLAGRDIDPHAKRDRGTVLQVAYPLACRFLGAGAVAVGTIAPPHVSEAYRRYWDSLSAYLGTAERQYSSQELVFVQYRADEAGLLRTVAVPYDHIRLVVGSYGEDVSVSSMTCGEALHLWGRMNVGNEDEDEEQFLKGLEETQDKGNNPSGAAPSKPVGTTTEQDELSALDTDSWVTKVLSTNGNDPKKTAQALGFGQIPLLCRAYESYAVQSARHACLHVLLQWPGSVSFDATHLGGPKSLLDFAKVIVSGADGMFSGEGARLAVITQKISENISSAFSGAGTSVGYSLLSQQSNSNSSTLGSEGKANFMLHSAKEFIPALRRQIANLVRAENMSASGTSTDLWLCGRCGLKNKVTSTCKACGERHDGGGRTTDFTPVLINDSKSNMKVISVQSSEDSQNQGYQSGIAEAESNHPATVNKKSFIQIPGATAMWITFDSNTCTDPNDPTAYLAFYLDASRTHCVAMFSGRAHSFKPFLVRTPTGKLFYTHCPGKPGVGDTHWGFRLKAHRANGMAWGGERETLRSPSLEWGTWLVEFLLSECLPQTTLSKGVIHNASLVSVMLKHICSHAAPFKQRIVALLCRVLSQPSYFSQNDHPPLHIILNEIKPVLDQKLQEAPSTGLVFLPTALLQVYELVATASAAHYMLGKKWQFFTPVTSLVPAPFRRLRESLGQDEVQECPKGIIDLSGPSHGWFPPVIADCSAPELPELQALRALKAMVFAREILKSLAVGARIPDAWLYRAAEMAHDGGPVSKSEDAYRVAPGRKPFSLTESSLAKLQQAMVGISGLSLAYRTGMLTASTSTDESLKRPVAELKRAALWNIPLEDVEDMVPGILHHHSHRIDEELVEWASMKASTEEIRVSTLSVWNIELSEQEKHTYPALNCLTIETLRLRLALIVILNKLLARCLTVVDTSGSVGEWSVGALLKQVSHLIFPETQADVIESAIEQSSTYEESGIHISLDNTAAEKSAELGKNDINSSQCMFVQLFHKLRHCRAKTLRSRLDDKDRLFKVSFLNEAGIDWGGIYRDCIARAVHDLFTLPNPHVNLCKRARSALLAEEQGNAADDDTWVPNASLLQGAGASTTNSRLALYMLQFVGVLMGISWRSRAWLDFMFAPCVWKLIAGDETQLDESDIEMLDPDKGALLKRLKAFLTRMQIELIRGNSATDSKIWEDEFAECFPDLCFVDEDSRGRPEELITNGASTRVTAATASSFCQMIAERRLGPLRKPTRAIRKGLLNIIPERAVQLCRWRDLQRMVCGPSEIDMAMLQRHTKYIAPFNSDHYLIKAFWNVFKSLSMRERSMLIRYAWGRSKLPRGESNWYTADGRRTHFLLTPFLNNNQEFRSDESMVEAHTCFFQLKLPLYSSEEVLRDKLMKSVAYGLARGTFDIA